MTEATPQGPEQTVQGHRSLWDYTSTLPPEPGCGDFNNGLGTDACPNEAIFALRDANGVNVAVCGVCARGVPKNLTPPNHVWVEIGSRAHTTNVQRMQLQKAKDQDAIA